jgi:hypothetical protein
MQTFAQLGIDSQQDQPQPFFGLLEENFKASDFSAFLLMISLASSGIFHPLEMTLPFTRRLIRDLGPSEDWSVSGETGVVSHFGNLAVGRFSVR